MTNSERTQIATLLGGGTGLAVFALLVAGALLVTFYGKWDAPPLSKDAQLGWFFGCLGVCVAGSIGCGLSTAAIHLMRHRQDKA